MPHSTARLLSLMLISFLASGCGHKGPLYLESEVPPPKADKATTKPAAASPAPVQNESPAETY